MHSAIAAFVLALVITTVVTPVVRAFAVGAGVVDTPGGRRVHEVVTPRLGGVAVMIGFFVPLAAFAVVKTAVMRSFMERPDLLMGLVLGAFVVGVVGAVDDVRTVGPWMKLAAQAVAAVIAYAFGYRIDIVNVPLLGDLDMGWLSLPLTVLWFLAITNAINLIDGLDGLAAGISLFSTVANFAIAFLRGSDVVLLLSSSLGGALVGFLRYNFNPATIFLGDSGSMFLGFALAATAIGGQLTKSSTAITLIAPVLALGIPIIDTLLAMVRRTLARQSIFAADRGHIHHRLLDLGFTHRRVVLTLYAISVALAVCAVAVAIGHAGGIGVGLAVTGVALFAVVRMISRRRNYQRLIAERVEAQRTRLALSTEQTVRALASIADEGGLRASLAGWGDEPLGLRAELLAGEPLGVTTDANRREVLLDVSSDARRRYLRISWVGPEADEVRRFGAVKILHQACLEAVARCATRSASTTARFAVVSAHASDTEE